MPNLINVLKASSASAPTGENKTAETDKQRMKEIGRVLKGGPADEESRGMEWGTCMVFSCEKDCCVEDGGDKGNAPKAAKECWREEIVLVQWDM